MNAWVILLTILHVLVCLFLIFVVLLQHGKGGDIAATFGGAGSQTAFGPRGGATVLTKLTTWSAIVFMITSITLSIVATRKPASSVLEGASPSQSQPAPQQTQPAEPAPQQPPQAPPQQ
jgi:preprotein translocase subunit SecG